MPNKNLPKWILRPLNKSYSGMIHRACSKYHLPKFIREKLINRYVNHKEYFFSFDGQYCLNPELLAIKEKSFLKKKEYFNHLRENKKHSIGPI